ncbi:MAG TPA: pilus assembly protein PilM [Polyangiaceae bacterium]|jgi:general secretion pathway protein L
MPTWLGIDIGTAWVKVALVRSTYRKLGLARLAAAEVVASGGPTEAIRAAVAGALAGERQLADGVAVAIQGSRAAIHRLLLPSTAQKQLADVLAFELEAQIPFDLEGAVFDWRLMERAVDDGQLPIVAAVARVEDVRSRIELVKAATSQEPERVGVGAFALAALVPYVPVLSEGETVAIVDLGAKASEVLLLERGEPVFARTISTGTAGLPDTADRLVRDLRVTFAAHRAQGGASPSRVFLCGGGAFVPMAEGFLSGSLELPVSVLPEPQVDVSELPPELVRQFPSYAKAVSLALSLSGRGSGLNLRRGPLAFERGFAWVRERIPVLAGLAAVILVSFGFSAWSRLHAIHKERDALESALGTVTKEVLGTEVTSAEEAQGLLSKEAALSDDDPMPHADGFDVMVRLSEAIPSTMKHDVEELDVQKSHVTVHGIVGSIPDAQSIEATLSETRCLSDVKIKNTTQAVGTDRQKYVLELDLKCPEDVKAAPKKKGESSNASASASGTGGK